MSKQHIVVLDELGDVGVMIGGIARELDAHSLVVHDFTALGRLLDESGDISVAVIALQQLDQLAFERLSVINEEAPALRVVVVSPHGPNDLLRSGAFDAATLISLTSRGGVSDVLTYPLDSTPLAESVKRSLSNASALRGWAQRRADGVLRSLGSVHAVTGARGGSGRTFFSINLAASLASIEGSEVCLVDLDVPLGSVALTTGLQPRFTIADLLDVGAGDELTATIDTYCEAHPRGFSVLASPTGDRAASLSIDDALAVVRAAQRRFSHVVVDLPLATNNLALAVMRQANENWCVLKADLASLQTHASVLSGFEPLGLDASKLRVVLNMVEDGGGFSVDQIDRALPGGLAVALPYTRKATQATNSASTIFDVDPNGTLARRLASLLGPFGVGDVVAEERTARPARLRLKRVLNRRVAHEHR